jgi:hypothetical protein
VSNGIDVSAEGLIVFTETSSGEMGVLDPATGEVCEVAADFDPRSAVSAGTRAGPDNDFQVVAAEGSSGNITIITDRELDASCESCTSVVPASTVVTPTTFSAEFVESSSTPSVATIDPMSWLVLPETCGSEGTAPVCGTTDEHLFGALRYPTTALGDSVPAALTRPSVRLAGTAAVYGSFEGSDNLFGFESCALCGPDCPIETCLTGSLSELALLRGVKLLPDSAVFSWAPDPAAAVYHLNSVDSKTGIADPRRPPGSGNPECDAAPPATSCSDADGLDRARPLIFYQALSACGPSGSDEGPF